MSSIITVTTQETPDGIFAALLRPLPDNGLMVLGGRRPDGSPVVTIRFGEGAEVHYSPDGARTLADVLQDVADRVGGPKS